VLPTILEIEYGAIAARFIAAARFARAMRENARFAARKAGGRAARSVAHRGYDGGPRCVLL
jgi:hypothetical protein